jgi:hypothetical protein
MDLCEAAGNFAQGINVRFDMPPTPRAALYTLPSNLGGFCERISGGGGELWLLLDELQGPGLNSTPSVAALFTHKFKTVSRQVHPEMLLFSCSARGARGRCSVFTRRAQPLSLK